MAEVDWLDAIPAAVLLVRDQQVLFANRAAGDLIGCTPHDLCATVLSDILSESNGSERLTSRNGDALDVKVTRAQIEHKGLPAELITIQRRESADLYRASLASGMDSFFLAQLERGAEGRIVDFRVLDANERASQQTRLAHEQLIGHSLRELLPGELGQGMVDQFAPVVDSGVPYYGEHYFTKSLVKDGWYDIQLIPLEGDRVALFMRDITERKEEEAVVQSLALEVEQQARLLDEVLSATPDAFILFDHVGRYLYVNRKALEHSGLTVDQVSGKTWRELGFPEEAGLLFEERLQYVFSTGLSLTYEEQFPTLTGLRDFLTTLTPVHDNDGNVVFMLNTIRDITERKEAEREQQKLSAALEQQARTFDEVLSTTPDTFSMIDRDGKFLYASPSALRNANLSAQEAVGKTWRELGFPDALGRNIDQMVTTVFATGETRVQEIVLPAEDRLLSFETIYTPLHNERGEVVAVVITNHDITERKQIEEALRENQRLFTSIYETTLVGIAVVDAAGYFVRVNRTYSELYGYAPDELIGKNFLMIFPPHFHALAIESHTRVISGQSFLPMNEWTVYRRDGEPVNILAYNSLLVRENGERLRIVAIIDVTAQKRAQQGLEESEQRLTSILNSMEDAVWSVRADTRQLFYVNPAFEALTGYSAEEFTANQRLLTDIVHPDDREHFAAQLQQVSEGARVDTEYRIIRRDGTLRWIRNRFWIVNAAEGSRIDGLMTDTTDHKRAAEQTMQLAIERERVHILSSFVRDASHEFRTPLSVINTRLYLMEKVGDPSRQAEYIDGIREQADRILRLVESLITMSQLDSASEIQPERLDVNHVLAMLGVSAEVAARRKGVLLTLDLSPEALYMQGEPDKLMTAFNAVLDNAVSYTPPNGQITIRSSRLNDREVVVDVRDTGVGIGGTELPHIFERFYRVDPARSMRGFGLGLPIARKIVEMHQGRIEVESAPQKGSLFRLIFPADLASSNHRQL